MHKEGQLTKAQKDEIKAKNMAQRDIYELNHKGNFKRCFPSESYVS